MKTEEKPTLTETLYTDLRRKVEQASEKRKIVYFVSVIVFVIFLFCAVVLICIVDPKGALRSFSGAGVLAFIVLYMIVFYPTFRRTERRLIKEKIESLPHPVVRCPYCQSTFQLTSTNCRLPLITEPNAFLTVKCQYCNKKSSLRT